MSDTPAITQLIATVQYSAKVPTSVRFANREAGLFLQVDITGLLAHEADDVISIAQARVKELVERAISAPESIDAVTTVQEAFPGSAIERGSTPSAAPAAGIKVPVDQQGNELPTYKASNKNACKAESCGSIEFYDARAALKAGTVSPKYPQFKCVVCGKGVWPTPKAPASA